MFPPGGDHHLGRLYPAYGLHPTQDEEHRSPDPKGFEEFDWLAHLSSTGQVIRIEEPTNNLNTVTDDCGRAVVESVHVAKAAGSDHAVLML